MLRPLALLIPITLAACSAEPPAPANAAQATMPVGSLGGVAPGDNGAVASVRGVPTASPPHAASPLQPLVDDDLREKALLGSGCAFRHGSGADTLLMVRDEGDGLVKYDKRLRRITAATPGREAIAGGAILAGDGASFAVSRSPGSPGQPVGAASATLTMRTADGGERVYRDGRWDCEG